jgi:HSP20 family protein
MLVRYWQPWREMDLMRRQFDQLFNELTQPVESQTDTQPTWNPAIELKDAGDTIVVRAQLPGMDAKDLNVEVMKEAVSIAGERRHEQKAEENGFFKSEFRYGQFRRIVPLPVAVQNDKVEAEYKDGVLTLTLPKVEEVRNKVVKVDLTASEQAVA